MGRIGARLLLMGLGVFFAATGEAAPKKGANAGAPVSEKVEPFARRAAEGGAGPLELFAYDGEGRQVAWSASHASIERTPPDPLPEGPIGTPDGDPDALRFIVAGPLAALPDSVQIESRDPSGVAIDELSAARLYETSCPPGLGPSCRTTAYVRAVSDDVDRNHPLVQARSVRAEVGGTISVAASGRARRTLRVGGPRTSPVGPIERLRGRLRIFMVRDRPGGAAPLGQGDAEAKALAQRQVAWANALWGQCGVTFGPPSEAEIRVVDPPGPYLLAFGCETGLPASGGRVRLRADGKPIEVEIAPRTQPRAAARAVAHALEEQGFSVRVSENARIGPGASPTADLLVRRKGGAWAELASPEAGRVSTDASLGVCIGEVDLSDGLRHFTDVDAPAGTLEERALVKAFDDGDPRTVEVFVIPAFAGGGRIGESFINADKSSVRNAVIEDRAGIRADRASFALAHELGHILLDMPGHPDDFGIDTPTLLMDSDSSDPSAFGPRRLTLAECARAVLSSGPGAATPLLTPWPLGPAVLDAKKPSAERVRGGDRPPELVRGPRSPSGG